jgi:hypothetical protein
MVISRSPLTKLAFIKNTYNRPSLAQSILSGTLKDKTKGSPTEGATVSLINNSLPVHTNLNGKFSFNGVSLPDTLTFTRIGYLPKTIYIDDGTTIIHIVLEEINTQ